MSKKYDIIVVGAGHAGCEAAAAAARLGSSVLLVTMNMNLIAQMSCNPSVGGIAKGQIVREIDALGGLMGIVTDQSTIQFRMLNRSKGPAMWSPRAQCDRMLFSSLWRQKLEQIQGVDFWQDSVTEIYTKENRVSGVGTLLGNKLECRAVILANGTFLNGIIHIGENQIKGGRIGEFSSAGITENLAKLGLISDRMKTGTPVRVDGRSLDWSKMEEQKGDLNPSCFSFISTPNNLEQRSCFFTYTSPEVHDILRTGFDRSPLFQGRIKGRGPRYCPSIEDKIERFSDRDRHQLFVEPEGLNTVEYYVNGFSSSLPEEVQFDALRKVPGFEKARFFRPGYAIEYDYFPPEQLKYTLESRIIENLFLAGQINGTTGYEEAAAQGLMAGINSHRKLNNLSEFILKRHEAYIGVLIDDLVSKGTEEPYRMFTSRAEYRLLLRQDNADIRLTPLGHEIGLADIYRYEKTQKKQDLIKEIMTFCRQKSIQPSEANEILNKNATSPIQIKTKLAALISRPQISIFDFQDFISPVLTGHENQFLKEALFSSEILIKYETYIEKEQDMVEKISKFENIPLKIDFDYNTVLSLSKESREKLTKIRPTTLGQASRISGVSPADISVLLVYFGK